MKNLNIVLRNGFAILPIITCLLLIGPLLGRPSAAHDSSLVSFAARATKTSFTRKEPAEIEFTLRNNGKDPIVVPKALRLSLNVDLEISDSTGNVSKWCGRIANEVVPSKSRYRTLAPGEFLQARLAVSCVDKNNPNRAWGYRLDTPGDYTIKARYRLLQPKEFFESLFPKESVARGPISAQPITVTIQ